MVMCVAPFLFLSHFSVGRDATESPGRRRQTGAGNVAADVEESPGLVGERAGAANARCEVNELPI